MSRELLTKVKGSLLEKTFNGKHDIKESKGSIFLDRDPKIFEMMLNYLRNDGNYIPKNVDAETKSLFGIEVLHWGVETKDFILA